MYQTRRFSKKVSRENEINMEKDRLYFDIIEVNIDRLLFVLVFRLLRLYVNYIKQVSY